MKRCFVILFVVALFVGCSGVRDKPKATEPQKQSPLDSCRFLVGQFSDSIFTGDPVNVTAIQLMSELKSVVKVDTIMIGEYPYQDYKFWLDASDTNIVGVPGNWIEYSERELEYYRNRRRPEYGSNYIFYCNQKASHYIQDSSRDTVASEHLINQLKEHIHEDFIEASEGRLRYREIIMEYPFEPPMELVKSLSESLIGLKSEAIHEICNQQKGSDLTKLKIEKLLRMRLTIIYDHKPLHFR